MGNSWINVTIPEENNSLDTLVLKIKKLEVENEYLKQKINYIIKEFENIPNAVRQFGYVELKYNFSKDKIVLIEKKDGGIEGGEK